MWRISSETSKVRHTEELDHPCGLLDAYCRRHPEIESVELSIYSYRPQSLYDERRIIKVAPQRLMDRFQAEEASLEVDQEIAFHSRVWVKKGWKTIPRHIPLIDFSSDITMDDIDRLSELAINFECEEFDLYSSGRSYHFYGMNLLSPKMWIHFMGRILLLNMPQCTPLVDTRWVGHRLIGGFSSLRWTQNTSHYVQRPRLEHHGDIKGNSYASYSGPSNPAFTVSSFHR